MIRTTPNMTVRNLQQSVAIEMLENRRFMAYAAQAEKEAYHHIASLFEILAGAHYRHAQRHLDELERIDPGSATTGPLSTAYNLLATMMTESWEYAYPYPDIAGDAETEDLTDIAEWFRAVARASKLDIGIFRQMMRKFT